MRQATPLVCIESIVNRAQKIETKLEDDLKQMYKLLSNITVDAESTRADLECIRRSLTLHRLFHIGERDAENRDLDRRDALDPGSIILKIVSDQEDSRSTPRGSERHADKVLERTNKLFVEHLGPKNLFRPKVLAKVQRNGIWFVGSSIAVSNFLRPIYLRNRILTFKRKLLKAMINPRGDSVTDTEGFTWKSLAFKVKDKCLIKPPCQNCREVFRNLDGFISTNDNPNESRTFLGACAEYCPVNSLLPDEADAQSHRDTDLIRAALARNETQCSELFRSFQSIRTTCEDAYGKYVDSNYTQTEHLEEVFHTIRPTLHIFGYLPECRLSL